MNTVYHLLGIGLAGGLGTLARYGLSTAMAACYGTSYPLGTFVVNLLGCFLFGVAAGLFASEILSQEWKIIVLTGFLGGFTTFSALAFENHQLLSDRRWGDLAFHLIGQNFLGVVAVFFGLVVVSRFVSP